ncbi:hypothetical protein IAD21_04451 [Abditibacteriota bacterium]|nr:hypothetical protein IAD21_04451 [Abditibacteriota bacterium]
MEKWFRTTLFATGIMNAFGALTFVPSIPFARKALHFPDTHPVYLWILAAWIFAFGACYLWMAFRQRSEWLFIVIGAIGKISFFLAFAFYWLAGQLPLSCPLSVSSDLIFGIIFSYWAFKHRNDV